MKGLRGYWVFPEEAFMPSVFMCALTLPYDRECDESQEIHMKNEGLKRLLGFPQEAFMPSVFMCALTLPYDRGEIVAREDMKNEGL